MIKDQCLTDQHTNKQSLFTASFTHILTECVAGWLAGWVKYYLQSSVFNTPPTYYSLLNIAQVFPITVLGGWIKEGRGLL